MTTDNDIWWEPPLAGSEAEHLIGALDRLRATFRWKADALDAAGLQARVGASALTLGGLLKHLAHVEDDIFAVRLSGAAPGPRGCRRASGRGPAGRMAARIEPSDPGRRLTIRDGNGAPSGLHDPSRRGTLRARNPCCNRREDPAELETEVYYLLTT
jgi:Protein of unknown function (DUF664)